jgi:hypothetical protein
VEPINYEESSDEDENNYSGEEDEEGGRTYTKRKNQAQTPSSWSLLDDLRLKDTKDNEGQSWAEIGRGFPNRTVEACRSRYTKRLRSDCLFPGRAFAALDEERAVWTDDEDALLLTLRHRSQNLGGCLFTL